MKKINMTFGGKKGGGTTMSYSSDPYYSIGEILRKKLMLSRDGTPYKSRIAIARIIKRHKLPYMIVPSPHGPAYRVRLSTIRRHNLDMLQKHALKSQV